MADPGRQQPQVRVRLFRGRRPRLAPVDAVGACLFAGFAGWVLVAASVTGGDPWPRVGLIAAVGTTLFVSRAATRRHATVVPGAVALAVAGLALWYGPDAIENVSGPHGYENATAALYVIAAGGAGMVVIRARHPWVRAPFAGLCLGLAVMPWLSSVLGGILTGTLVVVTVAVLSTRWGAARWRWPLPMSVAAGALALGASVIAGVAYQGDGEGDRAGPLSERRLALWSEAVDLVAARPVFGWGPGGFAEQSPTARADAAFSWAHSEPLHLAAESGVPAALLLVAVVLWTFAWLYAGGGRRGSALVAVVLAAAIVHACVDFVWHFPSVPLALAAVVGSGAAARRAAD